LADCRAKRKTYIGNTLNRLPNSVTFFNSFSYIVGQVVDDVTLSALPGVQLLKQYWKPYDKQAYESLAMGIAAAHDLYNVPRYFQWYCVDDPSLICI
jgi:hypothetical protein